MLVKHYITLS